MNISAESWKRKTAFPELREREVHLWRVAMDGSAGHLSGYAAVLSDEERIRAERFRFDRDRNLYVLSRGALRLLISGYTGLRSDALAFRFGSQGKPALDADSDLEFNLSHSGGLCVLAFARKMRIGIDIEAKARDVAFLDLAERFFAPAERKAIAVMQPDQIRDAFYAVWTRKEAYIKALGEGVTHGLDNFTVSVRPDDLEPEVNSQRDAMARDRWKLISFEPRSGFAGALAVEGGSQAILALEYGGPGAVW